MLDLATKRFDQMLSARRGKADQVHHHVRSQIGDLSAERSRSLIFLAIDFYSLSRSPRSVRSIRLTFSAADRDHLVPSRHQSGNEVGSNVSTSTNDNDAHKRLWHEEKKTEARHEWREHRRREHWWRRHQVRSLLRESVGGYRAITFSL